MDLFALPKEQYQALMRFIHQQEKEGVMPEEGLLFLCLEENEDIFNVLLSATPLAEEELMRLGAAYRENERIFLRNFNLFYQDYVRENEELRVYMEHKCAASIPYAKRFARMEELHIPAESSLEEIRERYASALNISKEELDAFVQKTMAERFY